MNRINVGARSIGSDCPCFLVAEIGINHNGDLSLAKETIDAAVASGADSVKFQNYYTEDFLSDRTLVHKYYSQGSLVVESQYDMFKRCELSRQALGDLKTYCDRRDVIFHSTPTSAQGIQDLIEIQCPILKNGSDYLTHLPLIRAMGNSGLPTVISTGMATREEIHDGIRTFLGTGNEQLIVLHCTSAYPAPAQDVHLRKLPALATAFGCLVGFSDHSEGIAASVGAVSLGACWIEKHFTLAKDLPGPDHRFSANPAEFAMLVQTVRTVEQSLGESSVGFTASEVRGREEYRLSCVARRDLPSGQEIRSEDLAFRRPGNGLPPAQADLIIGRKVRRDIKVGEVIDLKACA
jgi:N,N'-diacetyllegionaminate synthase